MVIIFEGDFVRDIDGKFHQVVGIDNWDENGDGEVTLENGHILHTRNLTMKDVLAEDEFNEQ